MIGRIKVPPSFLLLLPRTRKALHHSIDDKLDDNTNGTRKNDHTKFNPHLFV